MTRNFLTISQYGEVQRHDTAEEAARFIASGHTVIEVAPESAVANVRLFIVDEDGYRARECE